MGEYFIDNNNINTKPLGDSSKTNKIFYSKENTANEGIYTKVRGRKLILYGDKRTKAKIIYIDEHKLIIEVKSFRAGKIKSRKSGVIEEQTYLTTKLRTIYMR